jgi:rhamnosyltransferase
VIELVTAVEPEVSVIIRTRDRVRELEQAVASVRAQSVPCEIVVVDSGSSDGTLQLAQRLADRTLSLAGPFSYGGALNRGAEAARGVIHVALSSHCRLPRSDWVELAGRLLAQDEVAAAGGVLELFDRTPATEGEPVFQSLDLAQTYPFWGLSNHAAAWRAEVWREERFDERLAYAEDKEWALRVLRRGWRIAFDRALWVDMSHQWRQGMRQQFARERSSALAVGSFVQLPPYGLRGLAGDWWSDLPDRRHSAAAHRFLNYRRWVALAGRYAGRRALERRPQGPAASARKVQ